MQNAILSPVSSTDENNLICEEVESGIVWSRPIIWSVWWPLVKASTGQPEHLVYIIEDISIIILSDIVKLHHALLQ